MSISKIQNITDMNELLWISISEIDEIQTKKIVSETQHD